MSISIILDYKEKPTSHKCLCSGCHKPILKGQKRFRLGAFGYKDSTSLSYHSSCFLKIIKKIMGKKQKDKWLEGVSLGIKLME